MKNMLFVTYNNLAPTEDHIELARERGYDLIHVGGLDAFDPHIVQKLQNLIELHDVTAITCVNPALAVSALCVFNSEISERPFIMGMFEYEMPTFKVKALHLLAINKL